MADAWYSFYVGDYSQKTAHLSMLEHGAYILLINHYMATKSPLPNDLKKLYRICRANSPTERATVIRILEEFFTKSCDHAHHDRCDRELAKRLRYSESQSAAAKARHKLDPCQASARARVTTTTKKDSVGKPTGEASPELALEPEPIDIKKTVFGIGLKYLQEATGKNEATTRTILAKWCRDWGDAPTATALMDAQTFRPVEPISFIEKFLKDKKHEASQRHVINSPRPSKSERFKQALVDDTLDEIADAQGRPGSHERIE